MIPAFPEGTVTSFAPGSSYFFLSNFYPCKVTYEDITYTSAEHAYQATKVQDTETRMLIMRQPTATQAKQMGRSLKLRLDWEAIKFQVMKDILRIKFDPGSILAGKLRFTGGVDLVEGNYWHDLIWGKCHCKKHNWEGANRLGLLLMEVRSELTSRAIGQGRV